MKRKLGMWGEEIAALYLQGKGYKILDRNYYTRNGELDIICEKDRRLIFVEVKTRKSTSFGTPEEAITRKKINHLRQAAVIYLNTLERPYREIRFDVITILVDGHKETINHIEQAF